MVCARNLGSGGDACANEANANTDATTPRPQEEKKDDLPRRHGGTEVRLASKRASVSPCLRGSIRISVLLGVLPSWRSNLLTRFSWIGAPPMGEEPVEDRHVGVSLLPRVVADAGVDGQLGF